MPKMPTQGRQKPTIPLVTPLAATRQQPVFVDRWSDRHRIRTLKPQEVTQQIADWLTAPEIMEGLNAPRMAMGLDAFRAYVASFDNLRRNLVAIRRKADDAPLGLMMLEIDLRHKIGSLHVVIGETEDRNLGTAINATTLTVRHFFTERKMEKLTFQPLARNAAGVALCRGSFLAYEGTLRSHRIDGRTGERLDQLVFGMTRAEFDLRLEKAREAGVEVPYYGAELTSSSRR